MNRRRKFVLVSVLLSLGFFSTHVVFQSISIQLIVVSTVLAYALSAWALIDDLVGVEWLTILILPALYTSAVGMMFFLLPQNIWLRLVAVGLYMVGMYALLLIENIYSVARIRTIKLLNAASSVGLVIIILTAFLFYSLILSFKLGAMSNAFWASLVTWLLSYPAIWSVKLEPNFCSRTIVLSLASGLAVGQAAAVLSFWPVRTTIGALFLTTSLYVILGLVQAYLEERLYQKTIREYAVLGLLVLVFLVWITSWRGY